ncbi:hypothetical protein IGI04_034368 [Brassica rapa subsp. trilocularis]|uniref:Replication protein A 70 kDa DNA-binding subunit B/D first OB fold domain-containing protein n=1 Tax=Brassica rapa subsp. trilocularis TaxID=1813537 RepID=A0ABQ7L8K1_BRACM|nr:hypothetical protein IGI04_034368 [Brassica rapa subsp. trilocularis]
MSLSIFPVPQTGVYGVRHSTFASLRLGRSSQSIKDSEFIGITVLFFDENVNYVIHGFIPAGRANHYIPSLKVGSIVKIDRFEVARCSSMYKITNHSFLIHFISPTIIDEVITDAPKINLQSKLDCSTISKTLTLRKKQLESLSVFLLIRKKQSTHNSLYIIIYIVLTSIIKNISYPKFVITIPIDTNAATTSPPAHSSCLIKIAYMSNVNWSVLLSSYEK